MQYCFLEVYCNTTPVRFPTMKRLYLLLFSCFLPCVIDAQVPVLADSTVHEIVDTAPGFPGGADAFRRFVFKTARTPATKQSGRIFIDFVIETDGSVRYATIRQGLDSLCNNEALRVVKASPKWTPGKKKDKAVRTQLSTYVEFLRQ